MARTASMALGREGLESLDRGLARLSRAGARVRLRVGEALELLRTRGWHHELGFSRLGAYSLERCGRKGRWAAESCALARRLAELPVLRAALVRGEVGWSMAELVARKATADSEAELVAAATAATVRQMRARLAGGAESVEAESVASGNGRCVLAMTVDAPDAWALECTRSLFTCMNPGGDSDEFWHALLAEGMSSLAEMVPRGEMHEASARVDRMQEMEAAWRAEREDCCAEAEERCEGRLALGVTALGMDAEDDLGSYADPVALDAHIRRLSEELAQRDLLFGALAERFWLADGWRLLGFASERQYVRERLGVSQSSVKAKRVLARRAVGMPAVTAAIEARELGFEAALLLTRVATPSTVDAWVERARERTLKHLREEVEWAELRIRLSGGREQLPPDEESLQELVDARLETSRVLGRQATAMPGEPFAKQAVELLSQMSVLPPFVRVPRALAAPGSERAFGRVALRFWVDEDTRSLWRGFLECFRSVKGFLPRGVTPLEFLCATFHVVWAGAIEAGGKWRLIHDRDGRMCKSPVCENRLGLTAHHLLPVGQGGGDEPENLACLCGGCHIHGVHEGRLMAFPPASDIQWLIGRRPILVVQGRRKLAPSA